MFSATLEGTKRSETCAVKPEFMLLVAERIGAYAKGVFCHRQQHPSLCPFSLQLSSVLPTAINKINCRFRVNGAKRILPIHGARVFF
uniref:Uncharacterized protein n=1 Tax=Megaselia scalaris TaxID=36166 RepID=T1GP10_MEGSC